MVLEVACGGRYDSSNVIPHKDVAIITNIGLDHVGIIGNNKKEIAFEKAGIIKKGCTAFTNERSPKLRQIIAEECEKNSTSLQRTDSRYRITDSGIAGTVFVYKENTYTLNTLGEHQVKNATLCIDVATHLGISTRAIQTGLKKAPQPLRMEIVQKNPLIILDAAHNKDKIASTVRTIESIQDEIHNIHLVLGFSADKHLSAMMKSLMTLNPKTVVCTRNTMNQFRKVASPQEIERLVKKYNPKTHTIIFLDPIEAFAWGKKQLKQNDLLLATGSIFLSGQIRGEI